MKSAIFALDISFISSSLNSSVPHLALFSSAFSAFEKSSGLASLSAAKERFDNKQKNTNKITISEDKKSIINKDKDWNNSSYGSMEIPSTSGLICKWFLKIEAEDGWMIGFASKPFILIS